MLKNNNLIDQLYIIICFALPHLCQFLHKTGKSHMAMALALLACRKCFKVLYTTRSDMLNDLNQGVYEKTLQARLRKYVNPDLLVIDEMGHDRFYPNKNKIQTFLPKI